MAKPEAAHHKLVKMPSIEIGSLRALCSLMDEKTALLHGRTGHDKLTGGEEDETSTELSTGSVSRRGDCTGSTQLQRTGAGQGTTGRTSYNGPKRRGGRKGEGARIRSPPNTFPA